MQALFVDRIQANDFDLTRRAVALATVVLMPRSQNSNVGRDCGLARRNLGCQNCRLVGQQWRSRVFLTEMFRVNRPILLLINHIINTL
jgi:hypothetical protein